jgi:hypothetical protein
MNIVDKISVRTVIVLHWMSGNGAKMTEKSEQF